jgi:hypothetical protein
MPLALRPTRAAAGLRILSTEAPRFLIEGTKPTEGAQFNLEGGLKMYRVLSGALLMALFAGGCALIANGPTQPVSFASDPPGATLNANGTTLGTTPTTLRLSRCTHYDVTFSKPGYQSADVKLGRDSSLWAVPDFFFIAPIFADLYGCSYVKFSPDTYQVTLQQAR